MTSEPTWLVLEPWRDDVVEAVGFRPRESYTVHCWLPVLGPTSYALLRLWDGLPSTVDLTEVDDATLTWQLEWADLAERLGVSHKTGRHSPLMRTLERLAQFGIGRWGQRDSLTWHYQLRLFLPPLTTRQLERRSRAVRMNHHDLINQGGPR